MSRLLLASSLVLVSVLAAACCKDGKCIKDPPCRACENPCYLTPIQKAALKTGTHALDSGPIVYSYNEKTYILFSEKGQEDFEKDPASFDEKGGVRLIRKGKTYRVDVNPGDDVDLSPYLPMARPFTPAPAAPK
jgi:hypothetical protein